MEKNKKIEDDIEKFSDILSNIEKITGFSRKILTSWLQTSHTPMDEIANPSRIPRTSLEDKIKLSGARIISNLEVKQLKFSKKNFRSILFNLISNSIKFRGFEPPVIHIASTKEKNNILLSIKDNGIGIEEKHLAEIFKMFFRASHVNAGSGIGLYIVNEAVKKLEGTIDVQSIPGNRTVFTIFIPNKA